MSKTFAFGIVDKNGDPYIKTGAISEEKEPLEKAVAFLNATPNLGNNADFIPFQVVELFWNKEGK